MVTILVKLSNFFYLKGYCCIGDLLLEKAINTKKHNYNDTDYQIENNKLTDIDLCILESLSFHSNMSSGIEEKYLRSLNL